jgi:HK97 family phage portal protein
LGIFSRRAKDSFEIREAGSAVLPPSRDAIYVNTESALTLAAVYRSVNVISATGSQLPLIVRRNGQIIETLITRRPDLRMSSTEFYSQTIASLALHGEAFWYVTRARNGTPQNLTVLDPRNVTVTLEDVPGYPVGRLRYDYGGKQLAYKNIQHLRLFSLPGSQRGLGPIQAARQDIETAMRVREFGDSVLSNGGIPTGVLSSDQFLSQDQADSYRDKWNEAQAQRGLAVLGSGLAYSSIALSPADVQFLDNQQFSTAQIGRLFGVPATWLGIGIEGSSITYSTSEDLARVFIQTTLTQYLTSIENAMTDLLPRGQQATFKLDSLLRADIKSRVGAYQALVSIGAMTVDEVRASEGLDDNTTTQDGSPV